MILRSPQRASAIQRSNCRVWAANYCIEGISTASDATTRGAIAIIGKALSMMTLPTRSQPQPLSAGPRQTGAATTVDREYLQWTTESPPQRVEQR
jgi:hypothetical protein